MRVSPLVASSYKLYILERAFGEKANTLQILEERTKSGSFWYTLLFTLHWEFSTLLVFGIFFWWNWHFTVVECQFFVTVRTFASMGLLQQVYIREALCIVYELGVPASCHILNRVFIMSIVVTTGSMFNVIGLH